VNILVDINHPAQVHLFKQATRGWQRRGHEVLLVAREKDVTLELLAAYDLPFVKGTVKGPHRLGLAAELVRKAGRLVRLGHRFRPDVVTSLGSVAAAWACAVLRRPHIAFEDTEHSIGELALYRPFTSVICTPTWFRRDLGPKQIRYRGLHELAYLHPKYFQPDASVLARYGLTAQTPYAIIRLVSWGAAHDIGQSGFSQETCRRLVRALDRSARVLITSETPLEAAWGDYRFVGRPEDIHHLLAFARLYVGEGATMATEAAVLGTPSIYVSSLVGTMGNFEELADRYDLLRAYRSGEAAVEQAVRLIEDKEARNQWQAKRRRFLDETIDVTEWMMDVVLETARRRQRTARASGRSL